MKIYFVIALVFLLTACGPPNTAPSQNVTSGEVVCYSGGIEIFRKVLANDTRMILGTKTTRVFIYNPDGSRQVVNGDCIVTTRN